MKKLYTGLSTALSTGCGQQNMAKKVVYMAEKVDDRGSNMALWVDSSDKYGTHGW